MCGLLSAKLLSSLHTYPDLVFVFIEAEANSIAVVISGLKTVCSTELMMSIDVSWSISLVTFKHVCVTGLIPRLMKFEWHNCEM